MSRFKFQRVRCGLTTKKIIEKKNGTVREKGLIKL